ncbi:hypothetical protein ASPZODRAFT_61473 [Penicilliopsis zonata CBS 506.65]|uniref:Major facilitator superfamily (MFS) profile domain-containing protein n=1 Tax=Penicilliopsis zonata CBS 506.65 TaxID=1073090 RepID=A0A1L9SMS5_9EURO|nr:hypothetical protein ASPZODRAFT_61473 [Penicilliopsis zonata CBS 506.65]OJJ48413.1 hypothetical protein ASPZODRAFT_61473 [Penicilliopsis zonata CBS 506.65]
MIDNQNDEQNSFSVWWEEPVEQDSANPMNWTSRRKWSIIGSVSLVTFLTPLASSMFAPGVPQVMVDFHNDSTLLATFVVSVFILGYTFGPLVVAPLSEWAGRSPIYHVCNVLFVVFSIVCAVAPNMNTLIAFRFFAGFVGVAPITIGSGTIADIMPREKRGAAMAIWSLGPLLGPVIGPVVGGFIVEDKGWRWVFWVLVIVSGASTLLCFLVLRETYAPIILEKKAAHLRKETGNDAYQSRLKPNIPAGEMFRLSILRPTKMLLFSPIVTLLSLYVAVLYGLLYILFTTFTFVYEDQYRFSSSMVGLAYLGSGAGMLLGLFFVGRLSDQRIKKIMQSGHPVKPEDRIPFFFSIPGSLCVPVGLFLYGWGADKHLHWIVPEIGNAFTGFGMIIILMCINTYLVDAFTAHAASAIAANTVLRSLLGALVPLGGLNMYDSLGLGWGNSLLGFIALGMASIPLLFRVYGERIRTNPRWQREW